MCRRAQSALLLSPELEHTSGAWLAFMPMGREQPCTPGVTDCVDAVHADSQSEDAADIAITVMHTCPLNTLSLRQAHSKVRLERSSPIPFSYGALRRNNVACLIPRPRRNRPGSIREASW